MIITMLKTLRAVLEQMTVGGNVCENFLFMRESDATCGICCNTPFDFSGEPFFPAGNGIRGRNCVKLPENFSCGDAEQVLIFWKKFRHYLLKLFARYPGEKHADGFAVFAVCQINWFGNREIKFLQCFEYSKLLLLYGNFSAVCVILSRNFSPSEVSAKYFLSADQPREIF
jgi:hypothetical protein